MQDKGGSLYLSKPGSVYMSAIGYSFMLDKSFPEIIFINGCVVLALPFCLIGCISPDNWLCCY